MREILFKAKSKKNNKWIYGDYKRMVLGGNIHYYIKMLDSKPIEVIPETVCQYTGVKDVDGKKIFEGDIVEYKGCVGCIYYNEEICMFMVKFHENRSVWSFDSIDGNIKITGNIHD